MSAPSRQSLDLAQEIRAAIAETAPPAPATLAPASSSGEEEGARLPLSRAAAHVTPSVPAGAPLAFIKRAALRALRFLWRDTAAFHALTLESLEAILAGLKSQRRFVEQFSQELAQFREEQRRRHRAVESMQDAWNRYETAADRRAAIENTRLAALEAAVAGAGHAPVPEALPRAAVSAIPPGVYSLFEERFRGTPQEIAAKQRDYLPLFESLPGPVLDIGCGRGEMLHLLAERGIAARGVEINPIAASEARASGLQVEEADAMEVMRRQEGASLGAVVALQVVEHWTPETTFTFLREARRAIAPGGLLLLETINSDSLSAWRAFYLDPSHVRLVPPEALRFLAEASGFSSSRIELRGILPEQDRLEERTENDAKLNRLLFAPQDYALIARVAAGVEG